MISDYGLLAIGVFLLVLGYLLGFGVLVVFGWVFLAVGALLAVLALTGRSVFRSRRRL